MNRREPELATAIWIERDDVEYRVMVVAETISTIGGTNITVRDYGTDADGKEWTLDEDEKSNAIDQLADMVADLTARDSEGPEWEPNDEETQRRVGWE